MAFGLTIGTERSAALQTSIQDELMKRGYSPDADPVMAEYITIMIINNKTPTQILSELEDLIGSDFDPSFVDWLFAEATKGAPESEAPSATTASTSTPTPAVRESPPHTTENTRRPPNAPRSGGPLYQQAIAQALPSTSPSAQKRTASARSPSPTGPANKLRRTDLPTGPRAMLRDGPAPHHPRDSNGPGGSRSLLDRMAPARNGHAPYARDDIQARIDTITGGSPDPAMMMMASGFPMGGMDIGGMGMTNPLLLQEMMMNQMALMTQMAGAMGIMNPTMMNGGFPMQPGMGGDMGMFNGMPQQMANMDGPNGRGRGRGRAGAMRGAGRGRGGHSGSSNAPIDGVQFSSSPPPAATPSPAPATTIAAPTPIPAPKPAPVIASSSSTSSTASQARPGFIPPERPQSPTLCKFGLKCTNPVCRYSHPSPVATPESGVVLSNEACESGKNCKDKDCIKAHVSPAVLNPNATDHLKPSTFVPTSAPTAHTPTPCRYGAGCTRPNCSFTHPSRPSTTTSSTPCKFGTACTRATCPFQHPEGRVLPSTFHRGLSTTAPLVSVQTPEAGSMSSQSQHRSVVFNKSTTSATAAELEKKLKEMEEKKSLAEKAVAQAEAAAAGKKDDASKPVAISA
ncbi:uncharacterized protein FIBRA_01202 [Fibroporia radiculosa]|uniref:Nab2 type CCCH zinc finger 4 domain-containing protein n=1 Tax=Fibroporia radiculosa TaxID=599839 RepID=J4HSX7_9APHY|nr:uncharacterized protein FIBRA_01202 [Fibroporia radiculosa]CCL99187.1 predicted protein [Fibroporia radiculosa]